MPALRKCVCRKYRKRPDSLRAMRARCKRARKILASCDRLVDYKMSWTWLAQCRVCGTLWAVEHPLSDQHGGGPACPYAVPTPKHVKVDRLKAIRVAEEDRQWLRALGPEAGPKPCRAVGCDRLRVHDSRYCAAHHFESVKGYRPPASM